MKECYIIPAAISAWCLIKLYNVPGPQIREFREGLRDTV